MYNVNDVMINGVRLSNLFSTQDEKWHSTFIRPVKSLYSMSRVQEVEGNMDVTIKLLFDQLRERFVSKGKTCEMSDWINFCEYHLLLRISSSRFIRTTSRLLMHELTNTQSRLGCNEPGYFLSGPWNP